MSTFLTTAKMHPALAARIAGSVRGRRAQRSSASSQQRLRTALRFTVIATAIGIVTFVLVARRKHQQEVAGARASLLNTVRSVNGSISADERSFMTKVEPWLLGLGNSYDGDVVVDELRASKALDATLLRESVYVRGPLSGFASSSRVTDAVSASTKDALLLCLIDPPASRTEKVVLTRVKNAYAGSTTANDRTHRLQEVETALHLLSSPWEERARTALETRELEHLQNEFAKIPIDEMKRAAKSELLIAVADEPGETGPADLDGERPHQVRLAIVDLPANRVLLRMRKRVDPNWLASATRSAFAAAVDSCALAFDVRAAVVR